MDESTAIKKRLIDVKAAIEKIETFVGSRPKRYDVFCSDEMFRSAVLLNIAIIGEAINQILKADPGIRISSARQIVNTRNYIIHGYDSLDNEILWGIVIRHIPVLKEEISSILSIM